MLVDEVKIVLKGGHGGKGKMSFYPKDKAGPDGGNGGKGGDIYIRGTSDLTALNQFSAKTCWQAQDGLLGMRNQKSGHGGEDITLHLPIGTEITDLDTGEKFSVNNDQEILLLCRGGSGGKGNYHLRSSRLTTPRFAEPGIPGQKRRLLLNLKFIADFGLIGLPNTGKSSLLNALTNAHAKTGDYEFTTLSPNLGVYRNKVIADNPGLIAGASQGKGLGDRFLKHIEKSRLILHCISVESTTPLSDYELVNTELSNYNPELRRKKQIILLTKKDLFTKEEVKDKLRTLQKTGKEIVPVSIYDQTSLTVLKKLLQ